MHLRFSNNNFYKTFQVLVLGLLLSTVSIGQDETTAVDSSALAGVRLPPGAQRVNESIMPAEIAETMQKIVAQGNGKLRQGKSEVLIWTGPDLKKTGAKSITDRIATTLNAAGWEYEVSGTENGITFFSVLRSAPERRGILGFFGEADGVLMFAWTEVHAAGASQPTNPTSATDTSGGSVSDYTFTTPSGFSRSDTASKITLISKDGEKTLTFLPLMESSGNLEADANKILWQALRGFRSWSGNGFEPDYGVFEKGRTSQGLDYYKAYRYATPTSDNDEFSDGRIDASILLVKLGGKVAVVVGRSPFQSDNHSDSAGTAMDLILYDLRFKSVTTPYDLKREMLGSWSAASSTVAIAYTFNANGTFNKGGAISFRTSHDATRDKVTTTSYGLTDRYSLAGNVITQTYKNTGEVYKYKVRVYDTKYDKDPWQQKMGFLSVTSTNGDTIVFRKSN
jgi:hypothetical protein